MKASSHLGSSDDRISDDARVLVARARLVMVALLGQGPLQVGSPHGRSGLQRRRQLPENLFSHELLETLGVEARPMD